MNMPDFGFWRWYRDLLRKDVTSAVESVNWLLENKYNPGFPLCNVWRGSLSLQYLMECLPKSELVIKWPAGLDYVRLFLCFTPDWYTPFGETCVELLCDLSFFYDKSCHGKTTKTWITTLRGDVLTFWSPIPFLIIHLQQVSYISTQPTWVILNSMREYCCYAVRETE